MKFFHAFFLMMLAVLLGLWMVRGWMVQTAQRQSGNLPAFQQVGDFELTDQQGEPVTREDLKGKVWIADFIFTRCGGPCPRMSREMKSLQKEIRGEKLRLVSFTVDPSYDTPEILARYAQKFEADPERWLFLTGDQQAIHQLSQQHFLLGVAQAEGESREPGHSIMHSTKFVLVDTEGTIRGYYDSTDEKAVQRLMRDAEWLLGQEK